MKVLELSGTNYQIGKQIGYTYHNFLNTLSKENEKNIKKHKKLLTKLKNNLKKNYPSIYEEIKGRSEGSSIDIESMIYILSPEIQRKDDGCTTIMMKDNKKEVYFSHNEDEMGFKKDNVALQNVIYDDHWIISYISADRLIGSTFGLNSYGLLFSSNYIFPNETNIENISRYILERYLMDAKSISDLRKRLKHIKPASPFSLNVVDIKNKKAYNFEKDLNKLYEYELKDRYARSNHFILKKGKTNKSKSSSFRHLKSKELIKKIDRRNLKLKDLQKVMNYKTKDYFKSIFLIPGRLKNTKTVANMSYSTKDNIVYINDYLSKDIIEIDLN